MLEGEKQLNGGIAPLCQRRGAAICWSKRWFWGKMISRILTLVESLPTSSIAEWWQTHPWADGLQEENEVSLEQGAGDLLWTSEWQVQVGRNRPHQGTVVHETATAARLEKTSRIIYDHLVQPSAQHLLLNHVLKCHIYTFFELLQGW
ncbi:hypothetical protein QYF61_003805 [Mycteria americana]|uniref:Uncharacterized protein n=1 Tax=Mycteria americana TaxID=33587 RepID=A0AAN7ND18_MYCAM|nr:hypothetical protein QYF61_003805 [Mycteria americana]